MTDYYVTENYLDTEEKVMWYFRKKTIVEKIVEWLFGKKTVDKHFKTGVYSGEQK